MADLRKAFDDLDRTPIMVQPDYTPFQLRKAALEAACAVQGSQSAKVFVSNLEAFENYLKDGTKP